MKPMRDLLVVEMQEEPKEKNKGGILFQAPRWAKPTNICKVLAVGPLVTSAEPDQYYLINPYAVSETEEKNIKIIREKDILCQMEK